MGDVGIVDSSPIYGVPGSAGLLCNFSLPCLTHSPPPGYLRQENTGREELTENIKGLEGRGISASQAQRTAACLVCVP